MAAAFDQVVTSTSVSTTSEDIGPIAPGGVDRFLMWGDTLGQTGASRDMTALSHDGKSGDDRFDSGGFSYWRAHGMSITGPNTTSAVATGTFSGNSDHGGGIVATFTGVDQTTPFEGLQTAQLNDDNPDLTVTSETDDLVVDFIGGSENAITVGGGGTLIAKLENIASYTTLGMAYEAGAASVQRAWNWNGGQYFFAAWNLNAAGGGAATSLVPPRRLSPIQQLVVH